MSARVFILIFSFAAFCAISCEKEERIEGDPAEPVSEVPEIWLDPMPTSYQQFDDITITVNYRDGNGDIGFANADSSVIFVTDNRADILTTFHIGPQTPENTAVTIEGTLNVVMENMILLEQSNSSETATFTVQILDRAGNWSNSATTPEITINQ